MTVEIEWQEEALGHILQAIRPTLEGNIVIIFDQGSESGQPTL